MKITNEFLSSLRSKCPETLEKVDNVLLKSMIENDLAIRQEQLEDLDKKKIEKNFIETEYKQVLFKQIIEKILVEEKISYVKNIFIDEFGILTEQKQLNKIDFFIGKNIKMGSNIKEYIAINCKCSFNSIESYDSWSLKETSRPSIYLLVIYENPYPDIHLFYESLNRFVIICKPKEIDDRKRKFQFDDMIELLKILNKKQND